MPTLSVDDFMSSRKAPASSAPSGPLSVDDFMRQKAASGHTPTLSDDVDASYKFLGNELKGVGQALNPANIYKGATSGVEKFRQDHPILSMLPGAAGLGGAVNGAVNTTSGVYQHFRDNNMDALANDFGNVAGGVIVGKALNAAAPSETTLNRLSVNSKALGKATGNMVKSTASDLGAAAVANGIPVVGHGLSLGLAAKALVKAVKNGSAAEVGSALKNFVTMAETPAEVTAAVKANTDARGANAAYKSFPDVQAEQAAPVDPITSNLSSGRNVGSIANQKDISPVPIGARNAPAWRSIPEPEAAATPAVQAATPTQLPSGRVPGKISTNATLPRAVTPTSSTNVFQNLPKETTQALVDATKAGDLAQLPAQAKAELTQAVKAGDGATVTKILDGHTAAKGVYKAVEDKVNVLAKYIQDHNIDPRQISTAADRQAIADAAYAHGVKNSMSVPKTGRYRGISDDTWKMVQDRLN